MDSLEIRHKHPLQRHFLQGKIFKNFLQPWRLISKIQLLPPATGAGLYRTVYHIFQISIQRNSENLFLILLTVSSFNYEVRVVRVKYFYSYFRKLKSSSYFISRVLFLKYNRQHLNTKQLELSITLRQHIFWKTLFIPIKIFTLIFLLRFFCRTFRGRFTALACRH